MRKIKTWFLIFVVSIIFEPTVFAQQGMRQFASSTIGCDSPENAARLDWLETKNRPQFVQELQDKISTGQCRPFKRGDRYDECNIPSRMIDGCHVRKIKIISENKDYWTTFRTASEKDSSNTSYTYGYKYVLKRASFGCNLPGDTEHLVWLQKANQSQFDQDLKQFISTGKCRSFTNETLSEGDGTGGGDYVLRGTALLQFGAWWVPGKDVTQVVEIKP